MFETKLLSQEVVQVFIDDILCASLDLESHISLLQKVFQILRESNIRLNWNKCVFAYHQVTYLGYVISQEGKRTDPEKVKAITNYPEPGNVSELKAFLGLCNFYGNFIPNMATTASPLYALLRKNATWNFDREERSAFQNVKDLILNAPCLAHYDPSKPLILATDAGPVGVAAILSQMADGQERPVAFASRSLSSSEKGYSQIDKEALAIIFGVLKFERFLLGRHFTLITDHRPLTSIFGEKKDLPSLATARLQRYAILLKSYDFSIKYRKGEDNGNADALSRGPVDPAPPGPDSTQTFVLDYLQSMPISAADIRKSQGEDEVNSKVIDFARNGWPHSANAVSQDLHPYYQRRNELGVEDGILMWGIRVIVPVQFRRKVLDELHCTHIGVVRMKSVARRHFWWPKLDADIELLAASCDICQMNASSPKKLPETGWPVTMNVWERVHIDFASFSGQNFLIVVDSASGWLEVKQMRSTTSAAVLAFLEECFARFGYPKTVHADNGPQFCSEEFKTCLLKYGIRLSLSPPYHPASNGRAERAVRTLKELLKKSDVRYLNEILFQHRITPGHSGISPAEMMLCRVPRSRFSLLHPNDGITVKVSPPNSLDWAKPGTMVWARSYRPHQPKWQEAQIVRRLGSRCFELLAEDATIKRHANQIKKLWFREKQKNRGRTDVY